jgi:hypothetical protein
MNIRLQAALALAKNVSRPVNVRRISPVGLFTVVDYNPQAFEKAYWEINSLRVYTPQVS